MSASSTALIGPGCSAERGTGHPDRFLTFLHLSDIHFRHRQGSAQFDLEAQLRKPLLKDIRSNPADGAKYDGLFLTGDIAFSGKKEEYGLAKAFLEEIYTGSVLFPERTYIIPGRRPRGSQIGWS